MMFLRNASVRAKTLLSIVFFGLLVGGLFWYGRGPMEIKTVTFSPKWVNQAQFAGIFVAKDLGFYEDVGIDLVIEPFETGDSVLDDLTSGRSDLGLMSSNGFLLNYSDGEPITALAAFYQVSPYMVASLKSQAVSSPFELKGKRLGIKGGDGAEARAVFNLLLKSAGLTEADATFVTLPLGPTEREDLLADRADVIGFYRTRLYQFAKEGLSYEAIYPEKYGAALYNDVLVATDEYIEENEDVIENFIEATVRGWEYAFDNREEAVAITLRYVTEDVYKDIDYERFILEQSKELMQPDSSVAIGAMELGRWERFYGALRSRGVLNSDFNVAEAFTTKYLP